MKKLVLLGAGRAHLEFLKQWAINSLSNTEVILVSPYAESVYSNMVPGYVAGHFSLAQCQIPLEPLTKAAKVLFIPSTVSELKAQKQQLVLANGRCLDYDYASLDADWCMDRQTIPGAHELALFARPLEIFVQLWQRMLELAESRPLRISIIGAGASAVELALAMQWRLQDKAVVSLITGCSPPCSSYSDEVQRKVMATLRHAKITLLLDECIGIEQAALHLANGATVSCDAPVVATGLKAASWLKDSGLTLDELGFVRVNDYLQSISHANVFAVNEMTAWKSADLSNSEMYAAHTGRVLFKNIMALLKGKTLRSYKPKTHVLQFITSGNGEAIAAYGRWSIQGRAAWHWKKMIDQNLIKRYKA
jgi:NADH dehydrogenase FAD-containing subunit